jgi:UDP-N-acetylmuramoyl-L-alanyl-D-glutamate--2,6-diaminopimelate ligase
MKLSEVLDAIEVIQVVGNAEEKEVERVEIDSRKVGEKTIFVAIKGFKTDGHKFIPQAIASGASAIVLDDNSIYPEDIFTSNNVVKILVENTRKILPKISNVVYGHPSKKMSLIGVTGTKGKTTTTYFLREILLAAGISSGLIGTNKNFIGDEEVPSKLTTPEANEINELLALMIEQECRAAVMEVSSHSISLSRVVDLDFDIGIFTNIASDHLDFHKTFENYLEAKRQFFVSLKEDGKIIYNIDDEHYKEVLKGSVAKRISYGFSDKADYKIKDVEFNLDGTNWILEFDEEEVFLQTKLIGSFNAYNASAAFATAKLLGIETEIIKKAILNTPQVPGRFEVVSRGAKKAIVDYSHTAGSLEEALKAVRHIVGENFPVYTVFGCGGDRDKTKRPVMGEIAERYSNFVIVTSDNPRSEEPMKIIEEIEKGMKKDNYKIIENREEAIRFAIENSEDEAVILIAGKGHETYQEIKGVRHHFSDKEVAEKYLKESVNAD